MAFERRIETRYEANTRGFDRGTRRVNRQLGRLERNAAGRLQSIDRRFERAARGAARLGAAIAAFASIQGLRQLQRGIQGAVDQLDNVAKTADKLGLTTTALQELRIAAELSGVATQTFDMAFQRFTRRAGEAAQGTGEAKDALKTLGVTMDDLRRRSPEQLFNQVADAIAEVEDPAQRLRLAFKLFDSEGAALVNALTGGSEGLERMRERARELGVVIDEDLIRRSVEAKDELTLLGKVIDANVTTTLANLGPVLVNLSQFFADLSAVLPDSAEEMEAFATALQTTAVAAAAVAGGRGIRAVTAAFIDSAAARRDEVAASQASVAAAQQEVRARRSALTTLQLQTVKQAQSAAGIKNAEAANKRLVTARRALTTAETQAAAATDRLTAAQARLSAATRITTGAMTALRRAFVFLGGAPGILLGVASAAFLLSDAFQSQADRLDALQGKLSDVESGLGRVRKVEQDLERDTEALKGANERLTTAIEAQAGAAADTARLEIDAINSRIAKNRELKAEYETLIRAQLAVAEGDLATERARFTREQSRLTPAQIQQAILPPGGSPPTSNQEAQARIEAAAAANIASRRAAIIAAQDAGETLSADQRKFLELSAAMAETEIKATTLKQALDELGKPITVEPTEAGGGGGGGGATQAQTDSLQELIEASDQRAFQLLDEIQVTRAAADEVAFLTEQQRLLNDAKSKDLALTPELLATIDGLARSYADISEELDKVTAARELLDEASERELSTADKIARSNEQLEALKPALIALLEQELSTKEAIIRANDIIERQQERAADKIREAEEDEGLKELSDGLSTAISQADSLTDALDRVLRKLVEIALQDALLSAFTGGNTPEGKGGPLSGFFDNLFAGGFDQGGPTGGRRGRVAGVVHGEEFVVRAGPAQRFRPLLEAINDKRIPGFASGGFVSPSITNEIAVPRDIGTGRGGNSLTIHEGDVNISEPGATPEQIRRIMAEERQRTIQQIVRMNDDDPGILKT